ncbi:MAG: M2 family metallopeptidase [Bacillota bacterium]
MNNKCGGEDVLLQGYWKYAVGLILIIILGVVAFNQVPVMMTTHEFETFLAKHEAQVRPLVKEQCLAYVNATVSGSEEDYQRVSELSIEVNKIYANPEEFQMLKAWKDGNRIKDPILKRQLDLLYLYYLGNQIEEEKLEEMINQQTRIEQTFNTYRVEINGRKLTDNEVREILKTSTDNQELEQVWKASKMIGELVAPDLLKLVKLRNEAARELGFDNFHQMQLSLSEQDPAEIEALFNELDKLTREAFAREKKEMDNMLAQRYKVDPEDLMPWHYQDPFFQEAPQLYEVNLDKLFAEQDPVELTRKYYAGLGMPVDDLIAKSDLYEKPGKYQHAYCIDIDREGDVRVVANTKPNAYWVNTLLHEYGHAAYFKYTDRDLPWLLRCPAHTFTTEAIAMMFQNMNSNPVWIHEMVGTPEEEADRIGEACKRQTVMNTLVFSRWAQVMYRFEKSLYENPDQDLNKLWWDLVEEYQMLKRPRSDQADWASKIHIASSPAYYHNYLLGNLLASQLKHYIDTKVLESDSPAYIGQTKVGDYLKKEVFAPGLRYHWSEMIEKATGEKLTPRYYAEQYISQ